MAGGRMDLREIIDRVHERIEIESVVGRRVQLKRRGSRFVGLCPFHAEKTPSFTVTPDRNLFKCFGCGKSGDAITFLQETEGLEFWEALRALADEAGVELPQRVRRDRADVDLREGARDALRRARELYCEALQSPAGRPAREYLERRSLTPETIREFGIGWAPAEPGWLAGRLRKAGASEQALVASGLAYAPEGGRGLRDRFWERVVFPIADAGGRTVGFGGRYLPGSKAEERQMGKYVNSPDGPLFPKGRLLYGLDRLQAGLRDQPDTPVLLCEGYLDVALLHQAGFRTSVAALGTALTPDHARRLRRFQRPAVLVLDPDPAGRRAARRGALLLVAEGVDVRVAELPDGEDPADLVAAGRGEELAQRVAQARDIIDWRLEAWSRLPDSRLPTVTAKAAREMAEWIAATPNPALADLWVRSSADRLGVQEESLRRLAAPRGAASPPAVPEPPTRSPAAEDPSQGVLTRNEREIAAALLFDPSLLARHRVQLSELELRDPLARRVLKWTLQRREEGLSFDLGIALEELEGEQDRAWLDSLRTAEMGEPRVVLERALEALPANRENFWRQARREAPNPPSDDDLARYRRSVPYAFRPDRRP